MINFDDPKVCKITKTADLMNYELSIKCPMCGEWHTVTIATSQLFQLRVTGTVNCLKETHSADDRELIHTGICPSCWENMFA